MEANSLALADTQNLPDTRGVPIDRVGITNLRYPIVVMDRAHAEQSTIGTMSLSVALPHHFKGTHMSRFLEVLHAHHGEITVRTLPSLLADLAQRLDADRAEIQISFPYFVERPAPVTGSIGLMDYDCSFSGVLESEALDFVLSVRIPVTSLCPCSKEISDYGAHNQRGTVEISVRTEPDAEGQPGVIWIEELIDLANGCASSPVYPLLKRQDERHVTMQAFDNPAFVEDIVRDAALQLRQDRRINWFAIRAVNEESIHNHDAFAEIEWTRPPLTSHPE